MNHELKGIGRKRSLPNLRYNPALASKDWGKARKTCRYDRCPGRGLNARPPGYEAGVFHTQLRRSGTFSYVVWKLTVGRTWPPHCASTYALPAKNSCTDRLAQLKRVDTLALILIRTYKSRRRRNVNFTLCIRSHCAKPRDSVCLLSHNWSQSIACTVDFSTTLKLSSRYFACSITRHRVKITLRPQHRVLQTQVREISSVTLNASSQLRAPVVLTKAK
jgi:hypothetical protein